MTDPRPSSHRVAIALGANLGDRDSQLRRAVAALRDLLDQLVASTFHETAPVDVPSPQPDYLNAAVIGFTGLPPEQLLAQLLDIERRLGRTRPHLKAPRTIDLDLILYGQTIVDTPSLTIPHPRFRDRRFVLAPLAEIAPGMVDPVTGSTIEALLARLPTPG